jgi:hypothetical protein
MHRSSSVSSSSVEVDPHRLPSRDSLLRDAVDLYVQAPQHDRGEIRAFGDLVEGLIADAGIADRRHVAVTLARRADLPLDLARRLVLDVYEVAGPVIAASPVLDAVTLRDALRLGEAHVRAVAKRLTPKINDFGTTPPAMPIPRTTAAAPMSAMKAETTMAPRAATAPAAAAPRPVLAPAPMSPLPVDPLDTPLARTLAEIADALRAMLPREASTAEAPKETARPVSAPASPITDARVAEAPRAAAAPVRPSADAPARGATAPATPGERPLPYFSVPVRPEPPRAPVAAPAVSTVTPVTSAAPPRAASAAVSAKAETIEADVSAPVTMPPASALPTPDLAPTTVTVDEIAWAEPNPDAGRSFFELDSGGRWRAIQRASLAAATGPLPRRRAGFDAAKMGERLYAAAVARDYPVLNLLIGDALDLDVPTAGRVLGDKSLEPLAIGLAAIGLEDRAAVSILLHLAGPGAEHDHMRDLAAMAVKIGQRTAEALVSEWRQEARQRRPEPLRPYNQPVRQPAQPMRQTEAAERREAPTARRETPASRVVEPRVVEPRGVERVEATKSFERAEAPVARSFERVDAPVARPVETSSGDPLRDVLDRLARQVGSMR